MAEFTCPMCNQPTPKHWVWKVRKLPLTDGIEGYSVVVSNGSFIGYGLHHDEELARATAIARMLEFEKTDPVSGTI